MFRNPFIRQIFIVLFWMALTVAGCRVTNGHMMAVVVLVGLGMIAKRNAGGVVVCYMLIPVLTVTNHSLTGMSGTAMLIGRLGNFALVLFAMLVGIGRGRICAKPPLTMLYVYLLVAAISSISGYFPLISYLKIVNFLMLIIGLSLISRLMQFQDRDLQLVRSAIMSIAIFFVPCSLLTHFIPSIGYSMQIVKAQLWGQYITGAELAASDSSLFNGMTWHSQALAPITACFATWVICDMLFVERRLSWLHLCVLIPAPLVLYMTRSRTGFFSLAVAILAVNFIALPAVRISERLKGAVRGLSYMAVALMLLIAGIAEVRNNAISKWLRKTDDVSGDRRSLADAMTSTRMGLIEESLDDFHRNPMFGMGFQVDRTHPSAYRSGMITVWSAPIEKGVLPVMVLGETGIIGISIFLLFLVSFVLVCIKKRYVVLLTLFLSLLATNMGEATFFSPAGNGGVLWAVTLIGGLCSDAIVLRRLNAEQLMAMFVPLEFPDQKTKRVGR